LSLIAMRPEHLELLVTREMPYGKYKGRLIADLPGNYLNWFARKGFPPGEIGFDFRCAHLFGMTLAMKKNKALNPVRIRLLDPAAVMF